MPKLKTCNCGGTPKRYPEEFKDVGSDELRSVICDKCGLSTLSWWSRNKANYNWNELVKAERVPGNTCA